MSRSALPIYLIFGGLLIAGLSASATLMRPIVDARADLNPFGYSDSEAIQLVDPETAAALDAPPEYALAVQAFGAFRSIITNIAFLRADLYKQEGRYYDAMQLAEWICVLQPRMVAVWEFHSWNMAWNISVTTYTARERWMWVYNGAKLLRDRGIVYNPRATNLYKQIGWIFENKMGHNLDEHHRTYKRRWAWRMHLLFGPPPLYDESMDLDAAREDAMRALDEDPLYQAGLEQFEIGSTQQRRTTELSEFDKALNEELEGVRVVDVLSGASLKSRAAALKRIRGIAEAPDTLEGLYAEHPELRETVGKLWSIGAEISDARLDEDSYWSPAGLAFTYFGRYRALLDPSLVDVLTADDTRPDPELARFDEILRVAEQPASTVALTQFLQKKVLKEVYKNDPEHMVYLTRTFGAMDWRSVHAQGLYWLTKGLIYSRGEVSTWRNDKTNTARTVFFCLISLARNGTIVFEPNAQDIDNSYFSTGVSADFFESMNLAYVRYAKLFDPFQGGGVGVGDTFRSGHANFLIEAVSAFHFAGRDRQAELYYRLIREVYAINALGQLDQDYLLPLPEFVLKRRMDNLDSPRAARIEILGLFQQSYESVSRGDLQQASRYARLARQVHDAYTARKQSTARQHIPPYHELQRDACFAVLRVPSASLENLIAKARLWAGLDAGGARSLLLSVATPDLMAALRRDCANHGIDPNLAFPLPQDDAADDETRSRLTQEDLFDLLAPRDAPEDAVEVRPVE